MISRLQLFAADPEHRTRIAKMLGFTVEDLQKQLEISTEYVAARFDEIFQTKEEVSEEDWPLGWENGAPGRFRLGESAGAKRV